MDTTQKKTGIFFGIVTGLAGAFGIWAMMALVGGLSSVNFSVGEMARQFLVATGNLGEYETLVDFYTHIKGVEYLMAGAFFVAFPLYFRYVDRAEADKRARVKA